MTGRNPDPKDDEIIEVVRSTVLSLEAIVERLGSFVENMEDSQRD